MKYILVTVILGILNFSCVPKHVVKVFTTDECSASKEGFRDAPKKWCDCCVIHDTSYWKGGTREERRIADQKLRDCVASKGGDKYKKQSKLIYLAVRLFGGSYLPFPWRWGYGWRFGHGYGELTKAEKDSVNYVMQLTESKNAIKESCIQEK